MHSNQNFQSNYFPNYVNGTVDIKFFIISKTGRNISQFSQSGENLILFSPGTQFIVVAAGQDPMESFYKVFLREVSLGSHGWKNVFLFEESLKYARDFKIIDQSYKNRVDVIQCTSMTTANYFIQSPFFDKQKRQQMKFILGRTAKGSKPSAILISKGLNEKLKEANTQIT